jgi:hypothetical protein
MTTSENPGQDSADSSSAQQDSGEMRGSIGNSVKPPQPLAGAFVEAPQEFDESVKPPQNQ